MGRGGVGDRVSDFTFRNIPVRIMDKLRVMLAISRYHGSERYRTLQEITVAALERGVKVLETEAKEAKRG